jgi:hypothetical protein
MRFEDVLEHGLALHKAKVWTLVMEDLDIVIRNLDEAVNVASCKKLGIALLPGKQWIRIPATEKNTVKYYDLVLVDGTRKKVLQVLDRMAILSTPEGASYPIFVPMGESAAPLVDVDQLNDRLLLHCKTPNGALVTAVANSSTGA